VAEDDDLGLDIVITKGVIKVVREFIPENENLLGEADVVVIAVKGNPVTVRESLIEDAKEVHIDKNISNLK